jgi:uncharacterized protein
MAQTNSVIESLIDQAIRGATRAQEQGRVGSFRRRQAPSNTGSATAAGPSFDCARAAKPAERAICRDFELAKLEREVTDAYLRARALNGPAERELTSRQRIWLASRDACGPDKTCLMQSMGGRLNELQAIAQSTPAPLPLSPPQSASPVGRFSPPANTDRLLPTRSTDWSILGRFLDPGLSSPSTGAGPFHIRTVFFQEPSGPAMIPRACFSSCWPPRISPISSQRVGVTHSFLRASFNPKAVAKYFVGGAPSNATAWAGAMKLSSNLAERVFLRPTPTQSEICRQAHPLTYLGSSARA